MNLDPEEEVISAALSAAAAQYLVGAEIELRREGHDPEIVTVSRAMVEQALARGWSSVELLARAIQEQIPGALDIEALGKALPQAD